MMHSQKNIKLHFVCICVFRVIPKIKSLICLHSVEPLAPHCCYYEIQTET